MQIDYRHKGAVVFTTNSDIIPTPGVLVRFALRVAVGDIPAGEVVTALVPDQQAITFDYSDPSQEVVEVLVTDIELG